MAILQFVQAHYFSSEISSLSHKAESEEVLGIRRPGDTRKVKNREIKHHQATWSIYLPRYTTRGWPSSSRRNSGRNIFTLVSSPVGKATYPSSCISRNRKWAVRTTQSAHHRPGHSVGKILDLFRRQFKEGRQGTFTSASWCHRIQAPASEQSMSCICQAHLSTLHLPLYMYIWFRLLSDHPMSRSDARYWNVIGVHH